MQNIIKTGRTFYAVGIAALGIQQFIYAEFRPVILPQWPAWIPGASVWAYLTGAALIAGAAIILFSKNARVTARVLGTGLLLFFLLFHVTFQLFQSPYSFNLGSWTDALKELALAGGAFIVAASYSRQTLDTEPPVLSRSTRIIVSLGAIFFSITMIVFGIDHFLYTEFVATLVPAWIPGPVFWTYFSAIALIGSGIAIILKIYIRLFAALLGIMLFVWFIILHIPRAVVNPYEGKGNEITSVFEALAFSGIALLIAFMPNTGNQLAEK